MSEHSRSTRLSTAALVALTLVLPAGPLAPAAGAVIVCQHPKKKQRLRVEVGPECRKKRWVKAADLGDVGVLAGSIAGVGGQVDALRDLVTNELGALCPRDPSKQLAARGVAGDPPALADGCKMHDGNEAACLGAFQVLGGEPLSCWYYQDHCLPCAQSVQSTLACVNACDPPECPAVPERTFSGGPQQVGCRRFTDQTTCEQHFDLGVPLLDLAFTGSGSLPANPQTCWWSGSDCETCTAFEASAGFCPSCEPQQCAARPGPPGLCNNAMTQQQCEQRYQLAPEIWGWAASCFWNGTACFICTLEKQFADGACVNDC